MEQNIDFEKYKYYFNGWIARTNKQTNKTEKLIKGKWVVYNFTRDIDTMAHVGNEDVMEIEKHSEQFLQEQLNSKLKENGK
jgi:hypothetical protein